VAGLDIVTDANAMFIEAKGLSTLARTLLGVRILLDPPVENEQVNALEPKLSEIL
jgi:hypothetical protein